MKSQYLKFNMDIGRSKPENIVNRQNKCPFCNYDQKEEILAQEGDILLIKNKYQVLDNAQQLLIIEGNQCQADIPDYTPEHMTRLIDFALKQWLQMYKSGDYGTVLFFKNHGPLSGGTMRHPHMQLIGLKDKQYKMADMFNLEHFQGIILEEINSVQLNLSTRPRVGFTELNITMEDLHDVAHFAKFIQHGVDFLRNYYPGQTESYNLFFYYEDAKDKVYVKIMPRYATSPLFIGFNIELVPDDLQRTAQLYKDYLASKK